MKAHCQFVRGVHCVFTPNSGVSKEIYYLHPDLAFIDADVLVRASNLTGPLPYLTEHSPVKLVKELLG